MVLVQTHLKKWWPSMIVSVLCVHSFFFLKNSRLVLMQGAWSLGGRAVWDVSWLCCVASCHILCKAGLENVNHLLQ